MSRIDELVAAHCPLGVEYASLTAVASYVRGVTYSKSAEQTDGPVAVLRANNITLSSNKLNLIDVKRISSAVRVRSDQFLQAGDILICAGSGSKDHIGKVAYIAEDRCEAFGGFMGVIRVKNNSIIPHFLFHAMTSGYFRSYIHSVLSSATINNLNSSVMQGFLVPLPPLEVQREIVRILDQFTELEARRHQYAKYLAEVVLPDCDLDWVSLGEVVVNHDSKRRPVTRAARIAGQYPYYGANGIQDYVNDFIFDGVFLLIGEDGSVKNSDGTPVLNWATGCFWVNNHAHVISSRGDNYNLRYLYYYLSTVDISSYVTGGTQPKLNQKNLNMIPVPVVPRSFQDHVVDILDNFHALLSDLNIGLPAELAARRKQYEYYRDRLLTFKELSA